MIVKRSGISPLTPASLAITIVGCLLAITIAAVGYVYWRKRRLSSQQLAAKSDDRSSSTASEEYQLESIVAAPTQPERSENPRYSVGIMSHMSVGPRSPRPARSPVPNNRYSVGMLSRTSMDPSVALPNPDRNRSRSRSRTRTKEEKDRAYARLSMKSGVMTRSSMAPRSPVPRSPMSPSDPLLSAGIMSRMASPRPGNIPVSPNPGSLSAMQSPVIRDRDLLEPPPRYS
ncbi:uncharacterized protein AB675_2876 [Cyphellophora attinorum]|uniref:Uncharacterized protein n=1 Tax=Cyphellophora attinorum TaxID=1664694 RepID=A0A0N0NRI6_9EURO|nr:uncharacterized protein AB675_2876 [Phialophora attinorum]KPI45131.1 hypothetical protein AB675_2876 [Phialophora attinorum]